MSTRDVVSYELYEGTDGLARLGSAWQSLEATGIDHVFQTFAHAEIWQRTVGAPSGASPLLVALREGDRVVGIFPACIVRQSGVPLLTWLGAPRVLDYGDVVFDSGATTTVDEFVAESLTVLAKRARGAVLYLTNVREDARAYGALQSRLKVYTHSSAPFVPVSGSWAEYLASRPRDLRKNLNRQHRRLSEIGPVETLLLEPGDPRMETALAALVGFQRARFKSLLNKTHLFDPHYVLFRAEQSAQTWGRIATLWVGGDCIGASMGAVFRGRYYSVVPGFDGAYAAYSPGVLLRAFVVRSCFENGWDPCDFCWGEGAHKYSWASSSIELTTFVKNDIPGSALSAVANARHSLIKALGRSGKPHRDLADHAG